MYSSFNMIKSVLYISHFIIVIDDQHLYHGYFGLDVLRVASKGSLYFIYILYLSI